MPVTNEDVEAACGAFFGGQAWTEFMPEKHKQGHRDQMLIALRSVEAARVAARGCAIEIEIKIGMGRGIMIGWLKRLFSRPPAEQRKEPKWHGTFLSEDEIVADMVAKIRADPRALKVWRDPASHGPLQLNNPEACENAGALMFAGMGVRNWYGLWKPECPYTENENCVVENGVIIDPRFADNVSGRIMDRVAEELMRDG